MWFNHASCKDSVGWYYLGNLILFLEKAECSTKCFGIQKLLNVEHNSHANLRQAF